MVKRLKTVPLQARISSSLSDALDARVKATKEAQGLEKSYGLKSLAVEDALRLYLEGVPAIRALFEEVLGEYETAEASIYGEWGNGYTAEEKAELASHLLGYRSRLESILGGMPPLKKEEIEK
jgi:hypothetical protein